MTRFLSDYAITTQKQVIGQVFLNITEEAYQNLKRFKKSNKDLKARLVRLPWHTPVERLTAVKEAS